MEKLAILGASGHGKVVADAALAAGWRAVEFFDDAWPRLAKVGSHAVVGDTAALIERRSSLDGFVVAIGNNAIRLDKLRALTAQGLRAAIIVHPRAVLSSSAMVGAGTVVFATAVVNPDARIGEACIINSGAIVEHDCLLGDGVHVSPGALLAGGVTIGSRSWIGIGASVRQLISIDEDAVVGAGAAVVSPVPRGATVMGVPARLNKRQ